MNETIAIQVVPLGDAAIVVRFGEAIDREIFRKVQMFSNYLFENPIADVIESVPAYSTVTIYYDPARRTYQSVEAELRQILPRLAEIAEPAPRIVEIPVCYGGEFGPDLETVAQHHSLTTDNVIEIHSAHDYLVYMLGFSPGFPYLGGMSDRISVPRRASPRLAIPAGSVGIAGTQTGVYPIETPGGWQLIGRTPLELFRPTMDPPTLLQSGDIVRFRAISEAQYHEAKKEQPQ